jgi:hypothetical protein
VNIRRDLDMMNVGARALTSFICGAALWEATTMVQLEHPIRDRGGGSWIKSPTVSREINPTFSPLILILILKIKLLN